jgi:hypothetical protein
MVRLIVFYTGIILLAAGGYFTLRWALLSDEPVYEERVSQKRLAPDDIRSRGLEFDLKNHYYEVTKDITYLSAGTFPSIEKESYIQKNIKIVPIED